MSNGIQERQNSDLNIARLAAQRQIYGSVEKIDTVNFVLTVSFPLLFAIIQEIASDWTWAKIASCCLSIAMLVLSKIISAYSKKCKGLAAQIQQEFDVDVYQMPWDDKLFGSRKNVNNEVAAYSKRIEANQGKREKLVNWFTPEVDKLPMNKAIAVCQRESVNWDFKLRNRYRMVNIAALALIIIVPFIVYVGIGLTVHELLFRFIMFLPALRWFSTQSSNLREDLQRSESLERLVCSTDIKTMEQLQFIQRDIFSNRRSLTKIPDWFYNAFLSKDEERERRTVELESREEI